MSSTTSTPEPLMASSITITFTTNNKPNTTISSFSTPSSTHLTTTNPSPLKTSPIHPSSGRDHDRNPYDFDPPPIPLPSSTSPPPSSEASSSRYLTKLGGNFPFTLDRWLVGYAPTPPAARILDSGWSNLQQQDPGVAFDDYCGPRRRGGRGDGGRGRCVG